MTSDGVPGREVRQLGFECWRPRYSCFLDEGEGEPTGGKGFIEVEHVSVKVVGMTTDAPPPSGKGMSDLVDT